MARSKRILYDGAIYHVMARGNRCSPIFVDDVDRLRFFEILGEAQQRYAVRWRSFTQMTTHYHAAAQTPTAQGDRGFGRTAGIPRPRLVTRFLWRTHVVIGSDGFQDAVRKQIGVTMHNLIIPRSCRALARPTLAQLFSRSGDDLDDRNRAIRRAQVVYGYRQSEIARSLNLHPNTVSKIVSRLAKQRFFLVRVE